MMIIGKQLIEIITTGMYNDPKMLYREYIQNAADSIDEAIEKDLLTNENANIEIDIDVINRKIKIIDNGMGIPKNNIKNRLCTIGLSEKENKKQRGFRGIGRLGGLGYCDKLIFRTKSKDDAKVSVITWNAKKLHQLVSDRSVRSIEDLFDTVIELSYEKISEDYPSHFFQVVLDGVKIFYDDEIMSQKTIAEYLSQVAPVNYNSAKFSFANKIKEKLSYVNNKYYEIILNGCPIYRPYSDYFFISAARKDRISDLRFIDITAENGELIGQGWYAITDLESQIYDKTIRGIRVRQDNIEVGGEVFLERFFTESRFSLWHIGEIHLTKKMRLNARRDDFEHNRHYETFIEQMIFIGRNLSKSCREASKLRNAKKKLQLELEKIEAEIANTIYLDNDHAKKVIIDVKAKLSKIENNYYKPSFGELLSRQINNIENKIENITNENIYLNEMLDGRRYRNLEKSKLIIDICEIVYKKYNNVNDANELISEMIHPYINDKFSIEKNR